MSFQTRKRVLLKTVDEKGSVEVPELAELLGISEITVRRDLATLAADGLIYRTHGGAMSARLKAEPARFSNKVALNSDHKTHIARLAAQQIQENDVVFLDCGSTVFRMCEFLKSKHIKVITNSLPVIYELMKTEVSLTIIGGELDAERQAVHGIMAEEHITRYQATKAFVGVDGISLKNGLSAVSEKEAALTLALARNAARVYLLCDSTKLEKDRYFPFAPLSLIDVLITDSAADKRTLEAYRKKKVEVLR